MPFSAAAVANEFLRLAHRDEKTITPLKMQKLVYFAHGWYLAITGRPLLQEPIQAWRYGPVISSLYQQFKECGSNPIRFPASILTQGSYLPAQLDREGSSEDIAMARQVITRVWERYSDYSASQLTTFTHSDDTPWALVPNRDLPEQIIPNDSIRNYFARQAANAR
jgi:uncharacterized phage-associated protein